MERIITITESELREVLENTVSELLTHSEDKHSKEQNTEVEPEGSHESFAQAAPAPVEKASARPSNESNGESNITHGYIAAVREDGEGFRIRDQWFKVTGSTRIETDLAKGKKVKVYFSEGEHCVFANAIYDAAPKSEETAVVEV